MGSLAVWIEKMLKKFAFIIYNLQFPIKIALMGCLTPPPGYTLSTLLTCNRQTCLLAPLLGRMKVGAFVYYRGPLLPSLYTNSMTAAGPRKAACGWIFTLSKINLIVHDEHYKKYESEFNHLPLRFLWKKWRYFDSLTTLSNLYSKIVAGWAGEGAKERSEDVELGNPLK